MHPRLLLDTHVLIRWLLDAKKLSREQTRILDRAVNRNEPVALSAMSLVEIALLVSGGKLDVPLAEFLDSIAANIVFRILPLTPEIAAEMGYLAALVDPADKAIVASARVHRLTLISSEQRIMDSGLVKVAN